MENSEEIRMTSSSRRVRGWLSASGMIGVFSLLVGRLAATPLGWLGSFCGAAIAVCLARRWPTSPLGRWLGAARWLWSLPVMAVTLRICTKSVTAYSYPGWDYVVPAALVLLLGWRGSCLEPKAQERYGKLMMWALASTAVVLVGFTLYMLNPQQLLPRSWADVSEGFRMFLLTAGAVSFLLPSTGQLPGMVSAGLGAAMVAVTTGAEGAALVSLLHYPFLTLCNAGAYQMRFGVLASALWVLGETAILTRLLSESPGGKWGKGASAVVVFLLACLVPAKETWLAVLFVVGAILGYIGLLFGKRTAQ